MIKPVKGHGDDSRKSYSAPKGWVMCSSSQPGNLAFRPTRTAEKDKYSSQAASDGTEGFAAPHHEVTISFSGHGGGKAMRKRR